jgi:hypothetical protein
MNISNEFYTTADFNLAVTLSLSFPIDSIDRHDPHRVIFYFKRSDELDQHLESYWRHELRVEPQWFSGQQKAVKTRIYQEN